MKDAELFSELMVKMRAIVSRTTDPEEARYRARNLTQQAKILTTKFAPAKAERPWPLVDDLRNHLPRAEEAA